MPNTLGTLGTAPDENFAPTLQSIGEQYPVLAPYAANTVVQRGNADDGRILEHYPPWESDNPNPGKITMELFDRSAKGPQLQSLVAADMLHTLGAIDPRTGAPVDPSYYKLKQELAGSMSPEQHAMNQRAYEGERKFYPQGMPSYQDWMNSNRTDAYVRGGMFPEVNPEWARPGTFTPQQADIFKRMKTYLGGTGVY